MTKVYETSATIEPAGELRVTGLPFAQETEVQITISPRRQSAEEFAAAWQRVCQELRGLPAVANVSEDEIRREIIEHRVGR